MFSEREDSFANRPPRSLNACGGLAFLGSAPDLPPSNRIELRLKTGETLPVSNTGSMMGGVTLQRQQRADAIDRADDEQAEPDKK